MIQRGQSRSICWCCAASIPAPAKRCYQLSRCSTAVGLLYELIIDPPEGITTMPIHAESPEQAYEADNDLFPVCRLALVLADGEPGAEID